MEFCMHDSLCQCNLKIIIEVFLVLVDAELCILRFYRRKACPGISRKEKGNLPQCHYPAGMPLACVVICTLPKIRTRSTLNSGISRERLPVLLNHQPFRRLAEFRSLFG